MAGFEQLRVALNLAGDQNVQREASGLQHAQLERRRAQATPARDPGDDRPETRGLSALSHAAHSFGGAYGALGR